MEIRPEPARDGRASDVDSLKALGWAVPDPPRRIPAFELENDRGESVGSRDMAGVLTVVSFWASWCEGCEEELRALQEFHATFGESDLLILPINTLDRKSRAAQMMKKIGLTLPVLWDKGFGRSVGVVGLPTNFVVDRTGCIVAIRYGPLSRANLIEVVRILGAEAPGRRC